MNNLVGSIYDLDVSLRLLDVNVAFQPRNTQIGLQVFQQYRSRLRMDELL
jgi:hypothetical protein